MTKQLEALITSEIADFFAGVLEIHTNPGGTNTVEEAQQQLTERVTRIASECEAALIAALEQKEEQRANWFQMAQKLGEDMDSAEKRIAELQKKPSAFRSDGGDISRDRIKEIADNPYGDEEKGWLARQVLDASPLAVKLPAVPDDTRRMDWLCSMVVDVREPLVYGSHSIFWSQSDSADDEPHHTTLRKQIDAAIVAAPKPESAVKK